MVGQRWGIGAVAPDTGSHEPSRLRCGSRLNLLQLGSPCDKLPADAPCERARTNTELVGDAIGFIPPQVQHAGRNERVVGQPDVANVVADAAGGAGPQKIAWGSAASVLIGIGAAMSK